jgi:hypothetical protein
VFAFSVGRADEEETAATGVAFTAERHVDNKKLLGHKAMH